MDCSSSCTGQTSRKLATRIKKQRSSIRNCDMKAPFIAPHFVDTGHIFDLAETRILSHANNWTARLLKETRLSNKNSTNKWIELPKTLSVLVNDSQAMVSDDRWRKIQLNIFENKCNNLSLVLTAYFSNNLKA